MVTRINHFDINFLFRERLLALIPTFYNRPISGVLYEDNLACVKTTETGLTLYI